METSGSAPAEKSLERWREFFEVHCDALFQTALLLTADSEEAEASVAAAIESLDTSEVPPGNALATMQASVVKRALLTGQQRDISKIVEAQAMLSNGLKSVLQLEPSSRICFALRMLLGYGASSCARTMGIEENTVKVLLRFAFIQLHSAVMRGRKSITSEQDSNWVSQQEVKIMIEGETHV